MYIIKLINRVASINLNVVFIIFLELKLLATCVLRLFFVTFYKS